MKSFSPAGMTIKAYYGLGARTFGNPDGAKTGGGAYAKGGANPNGPDQGGGSGGPVPSAIQGFTFAPVLGYVAAGIGSISGSFTKAATRHTTTADALATAADNVFPVFGANALLAAYNGGGMFVVGDTSAGAILTSLNGTTWVSGSGPFAPDVLAYPGAGCYDDVNNKVIIAMFSTVAVVTATPGSLATFAGHAFAGTSAFVSLGNRPGSGVTLGLTGNQGASRGNVHRSTDGGSTWTQVATDIFPSQENAPTNITWTGTQWVAFNGNFTSNIAFCLSTDNGSTWSAPATLAFAQNTGLVVASDGAGNLVAIQNSQSPNNYAVSTDHGSTWSFPNLFTNGGTSGTGVLWNGSEFVAVFLNAAFTEQFIATSTDGGQHWTQGSTIIDSP